MVNTIRSRKPVAIRPFRHLYPFQSRYHLINGHRLHYLDEGEGRPVVMLHGNPTWSFYFRSLVNALSPACRVVVPDHIGCGLSDKPEEEQYGYHLQDRVSDLEQLLERLGITGQITLVLHDWGGMIGMAFAARHPERICRIVVTNTAAFTLPGGKRLPLRLRIIRNLARISRPAVLHLNLFAGAALFMAPKKRLSRDVRKGLIAPYNCPANRLATYLFVKDIPLGPGDPSHDLVADTERRLHTLRHIPMLICWGRHDFVFDPDYLAQWRRRFPHAQTCLFHDAGHYLLEDKPAEVARAVKAFLKKHPA